MMMTDIYPYLFIYIANYIIISIYICVCVCVCELLHQILEYLWMKINEVSLAPNLKLFLSSHISKKTVES